MNTDEFYAAIQEAVERVQQWAEYWGEDFDLDVRISVGNKFFMLPWVGQFDGFTLTPGRVYIRQGQETDVALLTHEIAHVWQMKRDGWLRVTLSYLRHGYDNNPYEGQARAIAAYSPPGT